MHYVYVIYSDSIDELYYGKTTDLPRRLKEHRKGDNVSTAQVADWQLVYYEAYQSGEDARERESKLKQYGASIGHLKNRIENSIKKFK